VAISNATVAAMHIILPAGRVWFPSVIKFFIVGSFFVGAVRRFLVLLSSTIWDLYPTSPKQWKPMKYYLPWWGVPQWGVHPIQTQTGRWLSNRPAITVTRVEAYGLATGSGVGAGGTAVLAASRFSTQICV
jgi:hypothetical protein